MENVFPTKSKEVIESAPPRGIWKKGWCAYVFDQEAKQWDLKAYFRKLEVPEGAVLVHRCQMYIAPR